MKYLNKKDIPYYCYIREEDKPEANNNRAELMEEGAEETLCAGRMKEPPWIKRLNGEKYGQLMCEAYARIKNLDETNEI